MSIDNIRIKYILYSLLLSKPPMKTAVITVKIEPAIKKEAQETADFLGLSLGSIISAYLHQFVRTKSVCFSSETPNARTLRALRAAKKELANGDASPIFDTGEAAGEWLDEQLAANHG